MNNSLFLNRAVNFNLENISLDMIFRILYCIDYWNHNPKHYGSYEYSSLFLVVLHDKAFSYVSELIMTCYQVRKEVAL